MTDFAPDQTVYLPDGREAVYVMRNGDQHLVRVIREVDDPETGAYTYPDDKITAATKVYTAAPVEVWDSQVLAKQQQVSELDRDLNAKRRELLELDRNKAAFVKAAEKYPDIQDALDFIEGRITHVVQWSGYGGVTIAPIKDALEDEDTHHGRVTVNGMKLLCLFGTDTKGTRSWKVNHYRDGSGSGWATVWPARSEDEARAKARELVEVALDAWRSGDEKWWHGHISIADTFKRNPWLAVPEDWAAHVAAQSAKQRQEKIDKMRADLAKLESEV